MKHGLYDAILNKHSITGYLADKGLHPSAIIGNKTKYPCPIHKETKPSFMVYDNPDGIETFFCFGCHRGGNILSLYKELEGISFGKTISELGKGIYIADEQEIDIIIRKIREEENKVIGSVKDDLSELSLRFADLGYAFVERLRFDKEAIDFLEQVYKQIDEVIWREDYLSLEEMYQIMTEEKLLVKKSREIKEKMKKRKKIEI